MSKYYSAKERKRIVDRLNRKFNRKYDAEDITELYYDHPDWFARA